MTNRTKPNAYQRDYVTALGIMALFLLGLLLKNAEVAVDYMRAGLRLCASTVIPSLFPFMVVSEMLVAVGFGKQVGYRLDRFTTRLLGVSGESFSAILLGALCGFPIGAKTAISLYDSGRISRREAERLMTLCNTPSPGFLVSAVGVSLFGNRAFGVFLFFTALFSALAIGLLWQRLSPIVPEEKSSPSPFQLPVNGISAFTRSVSSATASMLSVCACVIFFTSIIGCLSHAANTLGLPSQLEALLFGIFEISSGVSAAAEEASAARLALCGFAIGWSGISVHCQILSLGCDRGISFAPYLFTKLLQGIFCALATLFYGKLLAPTLLDVSASLLLRDSSYNLVFSLSICLCFLVCVLLHFKKRRNG